MEKAYAKLNLTLDVVGKRPDGYHLLDTIFHSISLCDELAVMPGPKGIAIDCCPSVGGINIAQKAAELFFQAAGLTPGCYIRMRKGIPMEAGLGGGSADGAAVLRQLNELHGHPLSKDALRALALSLGADLPFALLGGHCRGTGVGENLIPLPLHAPLHFVLMKPQAGLSTAAIFEKLDINALQNRPDTQAAIDALAEGKLSAFAAAGGNVLQPVAQNLCPDILRLCEDLLQAGALYAAMTGSGSTVFGLFAQAPCAQAAAGTLQNKAPFVQYACSAPSQPSPSRPS